MDKFRVIWYLLEEFNKYGSVFPKSAKEISEITKISLTETYRTLETLTESELIWRVRRGNLYRYGLKEKTLPLLDKLYQCIQNTNPLPEELTINQDELEELAGKKQLQQEDEEKENEIIQEINKIMKNYEAIPEEICIEKIEEKVEKIANRRNKYNNLPEKFLVYIQNELEDIEDYIFGIKIKEGAEM